MRDERSKQTTEERYEAGLDIFSRMCGSRERANELIDQWEALSPRFSQYLLEFAMGDIYTSPILSLRERSLVTMAILTALGAERQLKVHVEIAMNNGITPEELEELQLHVLLYAGFQRAWSGLVVTKEVMEGRSGKADLHQKSE